MECRCGGGGAGGAGSEAPPPAAGGGLRGGRRCACAAITPSIFSVCRNHLHLIHLRPAAMAVPCTRHQLRTKCLPRGGLLCRAGPPKWGCGHWRKREPTHDPRTPPSASASLRCGRRTLLSPSYPPPPPLKRRADCMWPQAASGSCRRRRRRLWRPKTSKPPRRCPRLSMRRRAPPQPPLRMRAPPMPPRLPLLWLAPMQRGSRCVRRFWRLHFIIKLPPAEGICPAIKV